MKSLSKEDYLRLIESAQRDEEGYDEVEHHDMADAWIPAESPNKEKMLRARAASSHGVIDVLKCRKEQIRDAIYKCMNLQVGEFLIHIRSYNGHPKDKQLHGPLTLNINVMQERTKTPSGAPCKMQYDFDLFQDNRFAGCDWISRFNARGYAQDVPIEIVVDIIRWMQALRRMNAFL